MIARSETYLIYMVGQVWKKTGREDTTSSTAVLIQDGRTAPLKTLIKVGLDKPGVLHIRSMSSDLLE